MTHFSSLNARVECPKINSLINKSLNHQLNAQMFKYVSPIPKTALNVRFYALKYLKEKVKAKKQKQRLWRSLYTGEVTIL